MPSEDIEIISAAFAGPVISKGFGKRRGIFLSRIKTSGCRGFGMPNFLMKLAFHQDFCYHFACEKNWLQDEGRFKTFPRVFSPNQHQEA
jgi:hypothetical protein